MDKKTVVYAGASFLFSLFLVVAVVEIGFRILPGLLPEEFNNLKHVTYDSVVGSKLKPDYHITLKVQDGVTYNVDTVTLGFDGIGFRDDGLDKPPFAVVLGDSFTFGAPVNISDTWPEILEAETGLDFANMGVSAYSTEHEYLVLREYGMKLNPKLVVVMFYYNDFSDAYGFRNTENQAIRNFLRENSITYELIKYSMNKLQLFGRADIDFSTLQNVVEYKDERFDLVFAPKFWTQKSDADTAQQIEGGKIVKNALIKMKELTDAGNATLVVIMMPSKEQVHSELVGDQVDLSIFNLTYQYDVVKNYCNELDIRCFDLYPKVKEEGVKQQLYYKIDSHMNPAGYRIVADEILVFLKREGLVDSI